jgi:hypothetical protein
MPSKSARAKRTRVRKSSFRDKIHLLADGMEEPLAQATDLIWALNLMGFGLDSIEDKDAGQPILAVARALSENISTARDSWRRIMKAVATDRAGR